MRTTEKLTVTVGKPIAEQARHAAHRRGESLSALTDRALRNLLIVEALRTEPDVDADWLAAVANTVDGSATDLAA